MSSGPKSGEATHEVASIHAHPKAEALDGAGVLDEGDHESTSEPEPGRSPLAVLLDWPGCFPFKLRPCLCIIASAISIDASLGGAAPCGPLPGVVGIFIAFGSPARP
jgi:hypothetical protein